MTSAFGGGQALPKFRVYPMATQAVQCGSIARTWLAMVRNDVVDGARDIDRGFAHSTVRSLRRRPHWRLVVTSHAHPLAMVVAGYRA
jgi:hypothetical protein